MRVLLTGHNGYIGSVMAPFIRAAGHDVVGLDSYLFEDCTLGESEPDTGALRMDVRDIEVHQLHGFDAVIHLAALSNDPLGNLNPELTYEINHRASVRLARLAREAGVSRFLFASSCSLYGVAGAQMLDETAEFNPITAYGHSKVLVEQEAAGLADSRFSPVFLRNATAYGLSPRLRADVVVNNLVLAAYTTGAVVIQSDGTPWRPLVHVEDISRAFLAALEAPRDVIHNQAFNVGRTEENYQVHQIADIVKDNVLGSTVRYAEGAGPDPRCYRVDCTKIGASLPAFKPVWTVEKGVRQLHAALRAFDPDTLSPEKFTRMIHIRRLTERGLVNDSMRWVTCAASLTPPSTQGER